MMNVYCLKASINFLYLQFSTRKNSSIGRQVVYSCLEWKKCKKSTMTAVPVTYNIICALRNPQNPFRRPFVQWMYIARSRVIFVWWTTTKKLHFCYKRSSSWLSMRENERARKWEWESEKESERERGKIRRIRKPIHLSRAMTSSS